MPSSQSVSLGKQIQQFRWWLLDSPLSQLSKRQIFSCGEFFCVLEVISGGSPWSLFYDHYKHFANWIPCIKLFLLKISKTVSLFVSLFSLLNPDWYKHIFLDINRKKMSGLFGWSFRWHFNSRGVNSICLM